MPEWNTHDLICFVEYVGLPGYCALHSLTSAASESNSVISHQSGASYFCSLLP